MLIRFTVARTTLSQQPPGLDGTAVTSAGLDGYSGPLNRVRSLVAAARLSHEQFETTLTVTQTRSLQMRGRMRCIRLLTGRRDYI